LRNRILQFAHSQLDHSSIIKLTLPHPFTEPSRTSAVITRRVHSAVITHFLSPTSAMLKSLFSVCLRLE